MYQAIITSKLTNKEMSRASYGSLEALNEWVADCESKRTWGYSERWLKDSECPENLRVLIDNQEERIAQEEYQKPIYQLDEQGNPVMETVQIEVEEGVFQDVEQPVIESYETVPAVYETWVHLDKEYTVEIEDLSENLDWQEEEAIRNRKTEYPSIEECVHVILDHGLNSQEYVDLQSLRTVIKNKYKKPVR